jgi:hypothetical protein
VYTKVRAADRFACRFVLFMMLILMRGSCKETDFLISGKLRLAKVLSGLLRTFSFVSGVLFYFPELFMHRLALVFKKR